MMCGALLKAHKADVLLFEKNEKLGKKLFITGKGRGNLTNTADTEGLLEAVTTNRKFLYSAFYGFNSGDVMNYFSSIGLKLKTERGGRVFPQSNHAYEITDCLYGQLKKNHVKIRLNTRVQKILLQDKKVSGILASDKDKFDCDALVIATGGLSYPSTGSTGDGLRFADRLGHTVVAPKGSLVPFETEEPWCEALSGLTLKNVTLTAYDHKGKEVYSELGEMLFTHFGVSGPLVLSASAHMTDIRPGRYRLEIDLKPALDTQTLDKKLLRDFSENINKDLINSLSALLPSKLIAPFISLTGIPADKKVNSVTAQERKTMVGYLKHLPLTVRSAAPVSEAIITRGGVNVRELDPKTMQSKLVPGLYFAGEVIDCDAYTGGFNLQIAFQTANAAALSASGS